MHAPAAVTATGALLLCAACGGAATTQPARAWRANAQQLVEQLRGDVNDVQSIAVTRRAFTDSGELYVLLVAYSDLAGCSSMAAQTAAPPPAIRVLAAPCPHLERAAALFARAEADDDTGALRRAAREAALGGPALLRAAVYARGEK